MSVLAPQELASLGDVVVQAGIALAFALFWLPGQIGRL